MADRKPPKTVQWEPGLGPPKEVDWLPGLKPSSRKTGIGTQQPSTDPNRGKSVRSLTGLFRGLGGQHEIEALERAVADIGWIYCDSSNVEKFTYDLIENLLFISFKTSGETYFYPRDRSVWQGLLSASSKGKYVYDVVRDGGRDIQVYGIMP